MSNKLMQSQGSEIIMYQTEDGLTKIDVQMSNETVWLTRERMAELFQRDRSVIGKHIRNIFNEGELRKESGRTGSAQWNCFCIP